MKKSLVFLSGILLGCTAALFVKKSGPAETAVERVVVTDTVFCNRPVVQSEMFKGKQAYKLPRCHIAGKEGEIPLPPNNDTRPPTDAGAVLAQDSVEIDLPEIQRHYADSTYEAWVSGPVNPRLDSIRVFQRNVYVTEREYKPPNRWHIGVTAGYGYTPKGFQPYIGVGITYSLFSF